MTHNEPMRKDEFEAGAVWAYRVGTRLGTPAARVELVAMPNRKGPTKVKIRHLDGDLAGLDEFASMAHLRCPWKDWRTVERDEAAELAFLERMEDEPKVDRVVCQAATAVLLSSGEDLLLDDYRDFTVIDSSQVPGLERAAARAGMTDRPWGSWPCFKNRKGDIYVPNRILLDVAMAFAQAEPETGNRKPVPRRRGARTARAGIRFWGTVQAPVGAREQASLGPGTQLGAG